MAETKLRLVRVDPKQVVKVMITPAKVETLVIDGKPLSREEIKSLKEEVFAFKESRLWAIFQNTLAEQARLVMFEKSQSFDDMRDGKAMLRNLDVQRKIMGIVDKFKLTDGK